MSRESHRNGRRVARPIEALTDNDPELAALVQAADEVMAGARAIKTAREAAGLSQAELAARLEVSQPRISDMESGKGSEGVSFALLQRAVRACGFEPHFSFLPDALYRRLHAEHSEAARSFVVKLDPEALDDTSTRHVLEALDFIRSRTEVVELSEGASGLETEIAVDADYTATPSPG
jgi:transcriptional regulator with XRE-family HTH domain